MESFINVRSVGKSSLKQGPWQLTKELLMRVCSSVVTIVHKKQGTEVIFWHIKHLFTWKELRSNVTSVTKGFSGKAIWKFICRLILERSRMCALPAQRDLRQIGIRRAMKRHTTRFKILSKKNYLKYVNVKCVAKSSRAVEVWPIIWKSAKMKKRYYCTFCPLRFYTNSSMRHHGTKQHKPESILPVEKLEAPLRFDFGET